MLPCSLNNGIKDSPFKLTVTIMFMASADQKIIIYRYLTHKWKVIYAAIASYVMAPTLAVVLVVVVIPGIKPRWAPENHTVVFGRFCIRLVIEAGIHLFISSQSRNLKREKSFCIVEVHEWQYILVFFLFVFFSQNGIL